VQGRVATDAINEAVADPLNDLIGDGEQRGRYGQAERMRRFVPRRANYGCAAPSRLAAA
jgi:hypothetical protein